MARLTHWLAPALVALSACGGVFDGTGALVTSDGEEIDAKDIARNAHPGIDTSVVGVMYDGSQLTPISYDTYSDAESFYLLLQVQQGWDDDLRLQETQPFELRKFVGFGEPPATVPLPRNIRPLEDEIENGCQFVDTAEVGSLAILCNGEVAIYDGDDWTYVPQPADAVPTFAGRGALYFQEDPTGATQHPLIYAGDRRVPLAEPPTPINAAEEFWTGPSDGRRVRMLYRPDLLQLCAAVWDVVDGTVREDGCLDFEVPGAAPKSPATIGGDVDDTVFFGGGETNTKDLGDDFWATARDGSVEIVGRMSDRGNTLITVGEDIGGPQIPEYIAPTEVAVGEGSGFSSYSFFELFGADGSYDFVGDFIDTFGVGEKKDVCPDGEGLTKCRAYFNVELTPEVTRASVTRAWKHVVFTYDSRRRILVKPQDILRGSERETSTTIDPNRIVDDYIPISSTVPLPVWAQRVPGRFTDANPSFVDLSACATVKQDGANVAMDGLNQFPINMFDAHTIELAGCQPDDSGPPLNTLTAEASPLVDVPYLNPDGPYAWTMTGVMFSRGQGLPITAELPEVVGGADAAMVIATDDGWMLIQAPEPNSTMWTQTIVAASGTPAPRFVGDRRHLLVASGDVYSLESGSVVATLSGVVDPAEVLSLGHGKLLAHTTSQRLAVWSTANGAPTLLIDQAPPTGEVLDMSDDAANLLTRDGDVLRVVSSDGARSVDLFDLQGGGLQSAHMSADGLRVLLRTTAGGRPTDTLYELSAPTATTWTVTDAQMTTRNSPYAFRRATGEVLYQNDVGPGQPDYLAYMIYGTDGQRTALTQDSPRSIAQDADGNLLWFGPQATLRRANWDTRVVEDLPFPVLPEGNLDEAFYLEDGFVKAIALGDWYLYDGTLKRVSLRGLTYPVSGGRGIFIGPPEDDVDNGSAIWAGTMNAQTELLDPYEMALIDNFADQIRAFDMLFSARQEDGAFLRAPCLPYKLEAPQADYVTTPLSTWYCGR